MPGQSGVFLIQNNETLVAMDPTEFAAEVDFQVLLAKFPALLVGDQIDPVTPRRFILIKKEQSIGHDEKIPTDGQSIIFFWINWEHQHSLK